MEVNGGFNNHIDWPAVDNNWKIGFSSMDHFSVELQHCCGVRWYTMIRPWCVMVLLHLTLLRFTRCLHASYGPWLHIEITEDECEIYLLDFEGADREIRPVLFMLQSHNKVSKFSTSCFRPISLTFRLQLCTSYDFFDVMQGTGVQRYAFLEK